ncbi:MAG TPA: acetyl-CoA hydrolase/transferase C-terminal domain-containing protein [Solirubrobacteraceae bacterium]|nr:acetyl-CoA hydrolase/transferase C-terminal domain-containing protein [Solirubrobacteraceae bacterium]
MTDIKLADFVRPSDLVIWGQGTAEPRTLTRALVDQRADVDGVSAVLGVHYSDTFTPEHADHINFKAFGGYGTNARLSRAGVLDVIPSHISRAPSLIRSGGLPVDVVFVQVSPPDANGRYRLGLAADYLQAAIERARVVVAEVNPAVPRTEGETLLDPERIDFAVEAAEPPLELAGSTPNEAERTIAAYVAERVPDEAVLQFGIGTIPDAVCAVLTGKRDLGIHSGLITDGVLDLIEGGAVTNRKKEVDPGVTIGGVIFGTRRLYEFAELNPAVELRSLDYTHAASVIGRFAAFVSIQTAVEVDLTGQINAETLGGTHIGAVGGANDFVRGAAGSPHGRAITALRSTTTSGAISRIVPNLQDGVVTTPRSDVDLVVTEHGVAELRGRSLRERANSLIAIAHPDFRAALSEAAERLC